jgi:hypothetical protein
MPGKYLNKCKRRPKSMANYENLSPRELFYIAYEEIHRKEKEKEKEQQKEQPAVPLVDEKKEKTPLDYFREGYAEKKGND